jgi:hypothetical protein
MIAPPRVRSTASGERLVMHSDEPVAPGQVFDEIARRRGDPGTPSAAKERQSPPRAARELS